jgi:uncharacterized delta-60 repeat protein
MRYTSSGILDTTFGVNGVETSTVGVRDSFINSIAIDSSGKIVAGGSSDDGTKQNATILRYTPSGVLDSSFGVGGVRISTIGLSNSYFFSIAIDSSSRIVAGGSNDGVPGSNSTIARYTPSGVLDSSFGVGGVRTSAIGVWDSPLLSIAIDASGRIVGGGYSKFGDLLRFTVFRYIGSAIVPDLVPVPDPMQQSKITSISINESAFNTADSIQIIGNFVEKIKAIQINGLALDPGSWVQTSSGVSINLPLKPAGVYAVQLFNGSAPVLPAQTVTVTAPPVKPPVIAPPKAKVTYIRCSRPGHGIRITYGINPVCAPGSKKL